MSLPEQEPSGMHVYCSGFGKLDSNQPSAKSLHFVLVYLNYLLKLFGLKENQFNDPKTTGAIFEGLSQEMHGRILEEFSEKLESDSGRVRYKVPGQKRDRLALHIFGLAFHVAKCSINVKPLAEAMSISQEKACKYLKAMGAKIDSSGKQDGKYIRTARLECPLVFPKPSLKR